jgi:predicted DNA-binding transcriptional regulator AlpA
MSGPRLVNARRLRAKLGPEGAPRSKSFLERLIRTDPSFPRPIMIGRDRYWDEDESDAWIRARPRRQYIPTE